MNKKQEAFAFSAAENAAQIAAFIGGWRSRRIVEVHCALRRTEDCDTMATFIAKCAVELTKREFNDVRFWDDFCLDDLADQIAKRIRSWDGETADKIVTESIRWLKEH